MIRVYKIRATWGGQLVGFDSHPLPEDFDDMEAAETAIRAFNDKNLEIHEWGPAAQIAVCMFEEWEGDWRWVSLWVAAAEEHTRMVTQEPVSGFPDRTFVTWPNVGGTGLAFNRAAKNRTEYIRADLAHPATPACAALMLCNKHRMTTQIDPKTGICPKCNEAPPDANVVPHTHVGQMNSDGTADLIRV